MKHKNTAVSLRKVTVDLRFFISFGVQSISEDGVGWRCHSENLPGSLFSHFFGISHPHIAKIVPPGDLHSHPSHPFVDYSAPTSSPHSLIS